MQIKETANTRTTWSYFAEKDHPIWGFAKILLMGGTVALLLTFNASSFDSGEVRTVLGSLFAGIVLEGFNIRKKGRGD